MNTLSSQLTVLFRIACAMCFIGHGAFGIITKPVWCNYFAVFGIGEALAYQLMPVVGVADILLGIVILVYPLRFAAGWLVFWGLFTASLRPLSGEPFAEFLERAGNYGAPLLLILLTTTHRLTTADWFRKMEPVPTLHDQQWKTIIRTMQFAAFLLLLGHGWLNIIEKAGLLKQYAALGFDDPVRVAHVVGVIEITGAIVILLKPVRYVVLILFVWKMGSELFYPAYPAWEWIERGGSYAVLLGLWFALRVYKPQPVAGPVSLT
jgi:hypothetical protein